MKNIIGYVAAFGLVLTLFGFGYLANVQILEAGNRAPSFELKNQDGANFILEEYIGKKNLVIYFYPKDDTPGCTKEACKFRDEFEVFTDLDAMVIGISADSPESHQKFREKYNLPFTLLSDTDGKVRKLFGVDGNYNGMRPGRVTFIVDKKGVIQYVFNSSSDVEGHVEIARKVLEKNE